MKLAWTKPEVCKLFSMVAECKRKHQPLLVAFSTFAEKFCRKTFSVRNFYYSKLKEFEKNKSACKEFEIDLTQHQKIEQKPFSAEECTSQLQKVASLVSDGVSIRKACQEVSKGDLKLMLRLQNKFYATKKLSEKNIEKIAKKINNNKLNNNLLKKQLKSDNLLKNELKNKYFNKKHLNNAFLGNFSDFERGEKQEENYNKFSQKKPFQNNLKNSGNLIVMPKKQALLSDSEIESLFLGLVKLVKKSAKDNAEATSLLQLKNANQSLRQTIKALVDKEREFEALSKQFETVKEQKEMLEEKLQNMYCNQIATLQEKEE